MKLGPVEWMMGSVGAGLIFAAVANISPVDAFRAAVTRTPGTPSPAGLRPLYRAATPILAGAAPDAGSTSTGSTSTGSRPDAPSQLVTFTNPSTQGAGQYAGARMQLDAPAYSALLAWQRAYGAPIVLTGGYRTAAAQRAGYARNPEGFARPGTSWHEVGRAVDVHLAATGVANPRKGDPVFDRLSVAAETTGWCQAQSVYDKGEPWHWSYGGCG